MPQGHCKQGAREAGKSAARTRAQRGLPRNRPSQKGQCCQKCAVKKRGGAIKRVLQRPARSSLLICVRTSLLEESPQREAGSRQREGRKGDTLAARGACRKSLAVWRMSHPQRAPASRSIDVNPACACLSASICSGLLLCIRVASSPYICAIHVCYAIICAVHLPRLVLTHLYICVMCGETRWWRPCKTLTCPSSPTSST